MSKTQKDEKNLPSIFEKHSHKRDKGKNIPFSIFGSQSTFEGKLFLKDETRIAGQIEGSVYSQDLLIIEEGAVIKGEVKATNLDVSGTIFGKISVSNILRLSKSSAVEGEIFALKLIVEEGAKIRGQIVSAKQQIEDAVTTDPVVETAQI